MTRPDRPAGAQRWSGPWLWLGLFLILLVLKWDTLALPASLDSSWALYPAAVYLSENNFDVVGLLGEPTGAELGPNTNHTMSVVVVVTAVAISLLGDAALEAMHVVTLMVAALALLGTYRFLRFGARPVPAAVLTAVVGLLPVVNSQMGLVYFDVPVWAATVWAAVMILDDRYGKATGFAALASWVKASGVITAVGLGLFSAVSGRGWRRAATVALPGMAVASLHLLAGSANRVFPETETVLNQWDRGLTSLWSMPAALLIFGLALFAFVVADRRDPGLRLSMAMVAVFIGAYFVGPLVGFSLPLLSRHWLQVLPFLVYSAWMFASRFSPILQGAVAVIVLTWSIGSSDGKWHLGVDFNQEVLQERTTAAYDLIELQVRLISAAESADEVVFVPLNTWFRAQYPAAGFVDEPISDWIPVSHLGPFDPDEPATFPDSFLLVVDAPDIQYGDATVLARVLDESALFDVETQVVTVGRYDAELRFYTKS